MKTQHFLFLFLILFATTAKLHSQNDAFWGMTSSGGEYNAGCIFTTDTNGMNAQVVYSWYQIDASKPMYSKLLEVDGKLYGLTSAGGKTDDGVLFVFDPSDNSYTRLAEFEDFSTGRDPLGNLIQADNGLLYGMTSQGGTYGDGTLFSFDPATQQLTKLVDFKASASGANPQGDLLQASNGKLYGMTSSGGSNDFGALFSFDIATATLTKLLNFDKVNMGDYPMGNLVEVGGKLYGTTYRGGAHLAGVLFSYDPVTTVFQKLMDFKTTTGKNPKDLFVAGNGKIYGMTRLGGTNEWGVIFEYNPVANTFAKLKDLSESEGGYAMGRLAQGEDGLLYGLLQLGGENSHGTMFKFDLDGNKFTKLLDFEYLTKGMLPRGSMYLASDGKFYGMTFKGGKGDKGVLFEYNPDSDEYKVDLELLYGADGRVPYGTLCRADNEKLYGMTTRGGEHNLGVLFEYDPMANQYTRLHSFGSDQNGSYPYGDVIQSGDGKLYGMTAWGGADDKGVLFSYDLTNATFAKLLDFDGPNGSHPEGSLVEADNGKLYGMTTSGGLLGFGVLFEYAPVQHTYLKILDFDGPIFGSAPSGDLVNADNGILYGMTEAGGADGAGVIFSLDPSSRTVTKLYDFIIEEEDGAHPRGSLIQAFNGKLYGMTSYGGDFNNGTIFEYDLQADEHTKLHDFLGDTLGGDPRGDLLASRANKLYGMTSEGGNFDVGIIFEYDLTTGTFTKTADFDYAIGSVPYGDFIRASQIINKVTVNPFADAIRLYPVPASNKITVDLGASAKTYHVILRTTDGKILADYRNVRGKLTFHLQTAKGIYFVEVTDGFRRAVFKVVKN